MVRFIAAVVVIAGLVWPVAAAVSDWSREWPRTDFSKASVPLGEIMSGGPPKDGIPAVDRPEFVDARASQGLSPREP